VIVISREHPLGETVSNVRLVSIRPEHTPALAALFERNADTEGFDPFPLTGATARSITERPGADMYFGGALGEQLIALTMLRGFDQGHEVPSFGILVDRQYRNAGFGRTLTELTIARARTAGCPSVRLSVYASNTRAWTLYERLGFRESERAPAIVAGQPDERIVMMLELVPGSSNAPRIPVGAPALIGNERRYVLEALDSTWISSNGRFIGAFEDAFADRCGVRHAVAVNTGTAALHVALLALRVGPGDEVIVPALTYVASAAAVLYCGGIPVFAESDASTGNIDPSALEQLITPRTKAIMVVHLYGHPVDIDPVRALAQRHGLPVIEDAAEAHGAEYKGRLVGTLGEIATFSFYGNKIISCGEGGMVVTDDCSLADKVRKLRGQGQDTTRRYWFDEVGFNYRLTNVAAAIGLAQTEQLDWHVGRRREIAAQYAARLSGHPHVRAIEEPPHTRSAFWMNSVVLRDSAPADRDSVIAALAARGIETRPFFYPCHTMPPYRRFAPAGGLPVAERLSARGISLPSGATLTPQDVDEVCDALNDAIEQPL
jgi:perosamine synthetase